MKPDTRERRTARIGWLALAGALAATPGLAQMTPDGTLIEDMVSRGSGWSQLTDFQEMGQFALGLVEVTAMTAAIAWRSARLEHRRKATDPAMTRAQPLCERHRSRAPARHR